MATKVLPNPLAASLVFFATEVLRFRFAAKVLSHSLLYFLGFDATPFWPSPLVLIAVTGTGFDGMVVALEPQSGDSRQSPD
jgi:hypothetical protein